MLDFNACAVMFGAFVALAAFGRLCTWIARRRPGTLADRIRRDIANE